MFPLRCEPVHDLCLLFTDSVRVVSDYPILDSDTTVQPEDAVGTVDRDRVACDDDTIRNRARERLRYQSLEKAILYNGLSRGKVDKESTMLPPNASHIPTAVLHHELGVRDSPGDGGEGELARLHMLQLIRVARTRGTRVAVVRQ